MKLFTSSEMRAFDRAAAEKYGVPSVVLMENAALRVVEFLEDKYAPLTGKHIVVFCGKGNNGGDGLAAARHLLATGCRLTVLLASQPDEVRGDARTNLNSFRAFIKHQAPDCACLIELRGKRSDLSAQQRDTISNADLALDALLGTGFHGPLHNKLVTQALELMRGLSGPVIAIDLPSAFDADSGAAATEAVAPAHTVTFATPKRGMFLRDGARLRGELWLGDIGTPPSLMETNLTSCDLLTAATVRALLPQRAVDAHKGDAGRVVVIGGSNGLSGAPALTAKAALAAGAGLCIGCLPGPVQPLFAATVLEATSHALPADSHGHFTEKAADALPALFKNARVVALGPGLSRATGALKFARRVACECPSPLVVDADALYALPVIAADIKARMGATVLTPHPGEMAELLQISSEDVQNDRLAAARLCAEKYCAYVVLKGAYTVIATPEGQLTINSTGNSGMATGGSGDVLTGVIAGLLAQTCNAEAAALSGVFVHGAAGDLAYNELGNGLVAGDIVAALPHAIKAAATMPAERINSRLQRIL